MSEGNPIDTAADLSKCSACGLPISGMYASFGGNFVPPIAPKLYHMECVPSLTVTPSAPLWTITPLGMLMYDGWAIGDLRNRGLDMKAFILAALNAAEEEL